MALISESTLSLLRATYTSALMDACTRLVYVAPSDAYGYGQPTYTVGESYACLLRPALDLLTGVRREMGDQVAHVDAILYLPRAATVANTDRIRLDKLHGETVAARYFEIVTGPILDQVLLKCALVEVTDGSGAS